MEIAILFAVFVLGYCLGSIHEIQHHMKTLKGMGDIIDCDIEAMKTMAEAVVKNSRQG